MTLPWYPRDMGLYARDTKHLTMLEHGAYNLLLDYYYSNGPIALDASNSHISNASLLLDHSRVHRICGAVTKEEQKAVDNIIIMFFVKEGDFYRHNKADEVIEKQIKTHENRVRAGKSAKLKQCSSNDPQTKIQTKNKKGIESPSSESCIESPLTPQLSPRGGDSKPSVSGRGDFSIERVLPDEARERAKAICKRLNRDFYNLCQVYDAGIASGQRTAPKVPGAAFPAWIISYTKDKRL